MSWKNLRHVSIMMLSSSFVSHQLPQDDDSTMRMVSDEEQRISRVKGACVRVSRVKGACESVVLKSVRVSRVKERASQSC